MPFYPILANLDQIIANKMGKRGFGTGPNSASQTDWGYREHPITGEYTWHNGIDLGAPTGTPIFSPLDGWVEAAYEGGVSGKLLRITHNDKEYPEVYQTRYAHLHDWNVKKGDNVKRGQIVGYVGSTGRSTGPHLHFIVRVHPQHAVNIGGVARRNVDPLPYLTGSKKNEIMGAKVSLGVAALSVLGLYWWLSKTR